MCEVCGGDLLLLGTLGHTIHATCRDCGAEHSMPAEPAEED
jgi:hypothetical protein